VSGLAGAGLQVFPRLGYIAADLDIKATTHLLS
jgi:hypothetical protein